MGLYDRPYLRDEEPSAWTTGRSMVVNLIIINAALWVADAFAEGRIRQALMLNADVVQKPWMLWQLVTYGFVHDVNIGHVLFNMLFLYFFGSEIEGIYGRMEFLRFYLVAIVVAGLAWLVLTLATGQPGVVHRLLGASGGVMAVMALFVLHFPKRLIYIWGLLPVPAWLLGVFYLGGDLMGAFNRNPENTVANVAHLGGAAFGAIYFKTKMNLGRLMPSRLSDVGGNIFKPKLKIHEPDDESGDLNQKVDAILEKISREGEASLTKKERRTLEEASKRYQKRRG